MDSSIASAESKGYRLRVFVDDDAESPRNWDNLGRMVCSHRRYDLGDEKASNTELYSSWEEWLETEVLEPNGGEDEVVALPLYLYDHSGITMNTTGFSCPWDSGQVGWIYCTKKRFREETGYSEDELFSKDSHREPKLGEHVRIKGRDSGVCGWGRIERVDGLKEKTIVVDFDYCRPSVRDSKNVVRVPITEVEEVMANTAEEILKNEVETYDMYLRGDVYGYVLEKRVWCNECGHVDYEHLDSCWGFFGREHLIDELKSFEPEFEALVEEVLEKV